MLETRRVTHPWIQALPSPDISRQRVFTACLWKVNRVLADPPSAPVRTLAESVLQRVGLQRCPLERCQWRGQPGTRIFGFWILVELRIAPPPPPDRGAPIRFPKLLKHTLLMAIHKAPAASSPRCFFAAARTLDSGFWTRPILLLLLRLPLR